jgi:pimeloyl-ACP methyl ester carboxylesterase
VPIGYYHFGHGPGVVLVHGAAQSARSFTALAQDLSKDFAVFVPDRRGRGLSAAYGDFHGLRTEVADLSALLDATGCHYVFGLSSGAVIAIETALTRPDVTKLALYEPPLSFDGVVHGRWAPEYERGMRAGKPGSALAAALKGTADRTLIRLVPRPVLGALLNFAIERTADRRVTDGEQVSPLDLIPTVRYDIQTVREAAGPLQRFAGLGCQVLLVGGSKSAHNLTATLDGLQVVLPAASRVTIRGVGHTAADNSKQPPVVAAELRGFFS